jgi:hypothetical protein
MGTAFWVLISVIGDLGVMRQYWDICSSPLNLLPRDVAVVTTKHNEA